MATTAVSTSTTPGAQVGNTNPQTTVEPPGGPFLRHTQAGTRAIYDVTGIDFGGQVTNPFVASPGYIRGLHCMFTASGGVNGTNTVAVKADAPFNCVSLLQLKDAFGNTLMVGPGYEMLYLVPLFSGGFGLFNAADIKLLPSYSAPSVGTAGTGDFTFHSFLPGEFAMAYGLISGANSALQPNLQWNFATSGTVYSTAPGTLPTMELAVDASYWWLPKGVAVEPPGLGTTRQWVLQACNPTIGSTASTWVQFPRMGGYLDTIILICRDSTGARVDAWPTRLQLAIDGVTIMDKLVTEIEDEMFNTFGGVTRPTGVLAFSRKTALSQVSLGLLDSGETYLSTTPGTLIEVNGSPWGSIANPPATLNALVGQIVPSGNLIQGLPEL